MLFFPFTVVFNYLHTRGNQLVRRQYFVDFSLLLNHNFQTAMAHFAYSFPLIALAKHYFSPLVDLVGEDDRLAEEEQFEIL